MASQSIPQLSRRSFIRGAALAPMAPLAAQLGRGVARGRGFDATTSHPAAPAPVATALEQLRAVDPELADLFATAMASTLALVREAPESCGLRSAKALAETIATTCDRGLALHRQGQRLEAAGLGAWRAPLWEQSYAYGVEDHHMEDLVSALEEAPHAWAVAVLEAHRDGLPKLKPRAVVGMAYLVRHPGAPEVPESAFAVLE